MSLIDLSLWVTTLLTLTTLLALGLGFLVERRAWAKGRRVFDVPLKRGQVQKEAIGTAMFHVVFIPPFVLALHTGAIRFADGWLAQVLGFAVAWYGFTLFYYFLHRSMHHPRLFWMHRWHHASLVTTPMSGLSMHPLVSNPISYHSLHHARFDGHYGFVVAAMDRAFSTEWDDWLAVHQRVMDGQPLRSLREKLGASTKA